MAGERRELEQGPAADPEREREQEQASRANAGSRHQLSSRATPRSICRAEKRNGSAYGTGSTIALGSRSTIALSRYLIGSACPITSRFASGRASRSRKAAA